MKKIAFILMVLAQVSLYAQGEDNIWYFGSYAGIDFNSGTAVALSDGETNTLEGCASICDGSGSLKFYTDGRTVWNSNHQIMPNGTGLNGAFSSSQSALIVKKPGLNSIYLIFTTDFEASPNGLSYSEVDMSLQGGLGDVNSNKNILIVTPTCEKVTAVKHSNNIDYWILTHLYPSNTFHSYLLSSSGLNLNPVINNIGMNITGVFSTIGCLKSSSDGSKIAIANSTLNNVELFDFDNSTGILSNVVGINNFPYRAYGVEFSPDNNKLYVSMGYNFESNIFQFNLLAGSSNSIINSSIAIGSYPGFPGSLQLAPDHKIYLAQTNSNSLGVISNPNMLGTLCDYVPNGFDLGNGVARLGLPNFQNTFRSNFTDFNTFNLCFGDSTLFSYSSTTQIDSLLWNFDETTIGINNFSMDLMPTHVFSNPGTYQVSLVIYSDGFSDTVINSVTIINPPTLNWGNDTSICLDETLILDATTINASYLWQDNSTNPTFNVTEPGTYTVEVANSCGFASSSVMINYEICDCVLSIPNAFSPNNDGLNDRFKPLSNCDFESYTFEIFNRWGEKVYHSVSSSESWDGKYNGKKSPIEGYSYLLKYRFKNQKEMTTSGHLSLIH